MTNNYIQAIDPYPSTTIYDREDDKACIKSIN